MCIYWAMAQVNSKDITVSILKCFLFVGHAQHADLWHSVGWNWKLLVPVHSLAWYMSTQENSDQNILFTEQLKDLQDLTSHVGHAQHCTFCSLPGDPRANHVCVSHCSVAHMLLERSESKWLSKTIVHGPQNFSPCHEQGQCRSNSPRVFLEPSQWA